MHRWLVFKSGTATVDRLVDDCIAETAASRLCKQGGIGVIQMHRRSVQCIVVFGCGDVADDLHIFSRQGFLDLEIRNHVRFEVGAQRLVLHQIRYPSEQRVHGGTVAIERSAHEPNPPYDTKRVRRVTLQSTGWQRNECRLGKDTLDGIHRRWMVSSPTTMEWIEDVYVCTFAREHGEVILVPQGEEETGPGVCDVQQPIAEFFGRFAVKVDVETLVGSCGQPEFQNHVLCVVGPDPLSCGAHRPHSEDVRCHWNGQMPQSHHSINVLVFYVP